MSVAHSTLTGANLHENKGAAGATDNYVATATSGATVWKLLTSSNLDTTSIFNTNKVTMSLTFVDISTAATQYIVVPFAGTLIRAYSVIQGAIATADCVLTFKNAAGTTMTGGTITIAFTGSAAGDVDSCTPSANNTFTAGTALRVASDGASTNTVNAELTLTFTVTGAYA